MSTFSQITAEQTAARRDGERLFLSGCLHYSWKKLHAGQWISRKPETAAVDNGSDRDWGTDSSVRR